MKYIQALLALVALTSVAASPLPADDTSIAMRAALPFMDGNVLESREPKKGKAANGTTTAAGAAKAAKAGKSKTKTAAAAAATGLTAREDTSADPGLAKRAIDILNSAHIPTLASRKKNNGTATKAAKATGTAAAAKKAAKAAAKASKAAAAAAASGAATAAAIKRDLEAFADLQSRKKHNGTATTNNAATVTDPAALASKSAAKAAKQAAKASKKAAAAASATASAATIKRDLEIFAEMKRKAFKLEA